MKRVLKVALKIRFWNLQRGVSEHTDKLLLRNRSVSAKYSQYADVKIKNPCMMIKEYL